MSSLSPTVRRSISAVVIALLLGACEGQKFGAREAGAVTGAALGAGLGAIVGNQTGSTGAGIAIGSGFGALAGGLIGNEIDNQNAALDDREAKLDAQERELAENKRLIEQLRARGADVRSSNRGVVVNLPDVLFDFNSSRLTGEAGRTVRDIADVARTASDRRIAVEGHTDSVGTIEYNRRLSLDRARSVADALSREGVPRGRLSVRGLGESEPVTTNATSSGRARNRRVEVIIENR